MGSPDKALTDIRILEELADKDTPVHRRHPTAILLVTLGYIVAVASYGKYELSGLLPLVFYPLFVFLYAELPLRPILVRILPALPLVLGIGILNPLIDRQPVAVMAGVVVTAGWISFFSIVLRCILSVVAALLLISVVGTGGFSSALRSLGVPRLIVAQFVLTFRYLHVLGEEASRMSLAWRLRAGGRRRALISEWGPMVGQWLVRTLRRTDRLYQAMLCRGFTGNFPLGKVRRFSRTDALYLVGWWLFFLLVRLVDLPQAIGAFVLTLVQ